MTDKRVSKAVEPRTGDVIVYTLQSALHKDHGKILEASFTEDDSIVEGNIWCDLVPLVVNIETARTRALEKLDGLDRLVLGL